MLKSDSVCIECKPIHPRDCFSRILLSKACEKYRVVKIKCYCINNYMQRTIAFLTDLSERNISFEVVLYFCNARLMRKFACDFLLISRAAGDQWNWARISDESVPLRPSKFEAIRLRPSDLTVEKSIFLCQLTKTPPTGVDNPEARSFLFFMGTYDRDKFLKEDIISDSSNRPNTTIVCVDA